MTTPSPATRFPTCATAPDVLVQPFGGLAILWPRTDGAKHWFAHRVDSPHTWGAGTVCEPGNVAPIVAALRVDGFEVMDADWWNEAHPMTAVGPTGNARRAVSVPA